MNTETISAITFHLLQQETTRWDGIFKGGCKNSQTTLSRVNWVATSAFALELPGQYGGKELSALDRDIGKIRVPTDSSSFLLPHRCYGFSRIYDLPAARGHLLWQTNWDIVNRTRRQPLLWIWNPVGYENWLDEEAGWIWKPAIVSVGFKILIIFLLLEFSISLLKLAINNDN